VAAAEAVVVAVVVVVVVVEKKKKGRDGKKRSDTVSINRPHSSSHSPFISETQVDIIFLYTTTHPNI
jgi:hypothetical protein